MPQRFLRPGITNSDRWNSVGLFEEVLYVRLLTRVDDYGRYDARPSVLAGECFSVWNEKHPEHRIDSAAVSCGLLRLAAEKLIELYDCGGKKVLQVTQWQERVREGAKDKWPISGNPLRFPAESCGILPPSSPSPPSSPPTPSPTPSGVVCVDRPMELPNGFPKTEAEAVGASLAVGCLTDFAIKTWNKASSRGGMDSRGVLIRSWSHYLRTEWNYEQERIARERANTKPVSPSVQAIMDQNELKRVEGRINMIRSRATETTSGKSYTADQKAELAKLKNRKVELLGALGMEC